MVWLKRLLALALAVIVLFGAWLWLAPAKIDPVAWTPPKSAGFVGVFAPNDKLEKAEVIKIKDGTGPETVALDNDGRIYGGLQDGRIIRILKDGTQETFATIQGGRPLGMAFDAAGNLIVCDAYKGLLSVAPDGKATVLSAGEGGRPFRFTDDLAIASDGKIYFSDASDTYSQPDYRLDLLEARGHGRLLVYDPATGVATKLLDGLYFANGVALSADESFVLVNETGRYRVSRYWLKGDKAGTHDIFADNLPGFPDGISSNGHGTFWLAIPSPRNPVMDDAHPKPWLKKVISKLPVWMQPSAIKEGIVVALDEQGRVKEVFHDGDGNPVYMITSATQVGDTLYLGSLDAPQIVRLKVSGY
ncbi:SMP-30/gluconolactonase/LRE family protein [Kordiimonas sp. A6E486]|nr:SMP-30/gluconolactonase/LRE family protein [Kordiimonas marina]MCJ9429030.1 SMP-30/gluconolactonase/LRE family protein [Kordiimonas marina]